MAGVAAYDEVQLGQLDLPASVLAEPGVPLADLIGRQAAAGVDRLSGPPPVDGWRQVDQSVLGEEGTLTTLAARWRPGPNGWRQLEVVFRDGKFTTCVNGQWLEPRPGRAHRRLGLRLEWAHSPVAMPAGTTPELVARLRNVSSDTWINDGIDRGHVSAWVFDRFGARLPRRRSSWLAHSSPPLPTDLRAGESVELSAWWDTDELPLLPVGDYDIQCELTDVKLRSDVGVLRIRA
jgi:hypothetical protein